MVIKAMRETATTRLAAAQHFPKRGLTPKWKNRKSRWLTLSVSPKHVSADYYRMPVRPIYKSYPVYAPGKEPSGYLDWLKQQEPEILFDAAKLKTEADWIKAGEIVFDAPLGSGPVTEATDERTNAYYEKIATPLTKEGIDPSSRYVIREKGKVEIGGGGCVSCHTRVMPDGTVIKGAQGNPAFDRSFAFSMERGNNVKDSQDFQRFLFGAPWIKPDPQADLEHFVAGRHHRQALCDSAWRAGASRHKFCPPCTNPRPHRG
ncbi:MAG: hypothetical protein IPJ07_04230 [Acidobacteria bacterium]|nr:hypothetical protein [Acidobacteriota bacterium]